MSMDQTDRTEPDRPGPHGSTAAGLVNSARRRTPAAGWLTPARLLSLVLVVVGAYAAINIFVALRTILVMLLVALFLSFAMEPAVQWLDRHGWKRGPATGLVFLALFALLAALVYALTTLVVDQARSMVATFPTMLRNLSARFDLEFLGEVSRSPELNRQAGALSGNLTSRLQNIVLGAAGNVVSIGRTAVGVVFQLLSIALVTFYLVADGPRARQTLARLAPQDRQREMLAIWELAVAKTGGYIYSRLLLAAAATIATSGFLLVLGLPYPLPLGIIVGTTSVFIPVVGTYIGGIVVLLVAFGEQAGRGEAPTDVLWILGFLAVYQQLENYVLAPRLQARTMDIHPAVAFVSVLIGGTLLGAVGALLALPAAAILQALLSTIVRRHELISELAEVHLPGEERARRAALRARPAVGRPEPGVGA